MTFDSIDALKNYILSRSETAVKLAQERVYLVINRFVKEYYAEFSPVLYERTYQLFRSLVKTDVRSTGNGWVAEVYFDASTLDYSMKSIHGVKTINNGWDGEKTLSAAAHGHHGGPTPTSNITGTAIWDEPLTILNQEAINILKKSLIDAGIPVK